jgi:hypothetical protein
MNTHVFVDEVTPVHLPEFEDCFILQFTSPEHLNLAVVMYDGLVAEAYSTGDCLVFPITSSLRN